MKKHKATKKPKVKRVKLTPDEIIHIEPVADVMPVVVQNPETGAAVVLPIKKDEIKSKSWLARLLSGT